MDRTERFYLIDKLLHQRGLVTRTQFLETLGVSPATFKRDLEYMRERLHAPITWNVDRGGYEFGNVNGYGHPYQLPGMWFNPSEIHALLTMQALLADIEPGLLATHIAPLKSRLEAMLEEGAVAADEVHRRIRVLRQAARRPPVAIFETIASALLARKRLRIAYHARSTGLPTERDVSPQRLVHYRDNWYVDAWCHLRDDLRKFSVDAIATADVLGDDARDVDLDALERQLASGYGIFAGDDVTWATLRFTPARARWVAQEQWHPAQRSRLEADGAFVLEVPFTDPRELMMDVLKYGGDVEVLAPASLRSAVADEARRMLARHDPAG